MRGIYSPLKICIDVIIICSFRITIPKAFTAVEVWPVQLTIAPLDQVISEAGKFKRKKAGGKPPIGQAHDMFSRIFRIRIYKYFLPNIMHYML